MDSNMFYGKVSEINCSQMSALSNQVTVFSFISSHVCMLLFFISLFHRSWLISTVHGL